MKVPKFNMYFPSQDVMDNDQLSFYKMVESNLNKGNYIDVDGNISYVFVFIYKVLARWNEDGFDHLSEFLIYLSEIYKHEAKLADYCLYWAFDCLLGLEKYEEYLNRTEPKEVVGSRTHQSNLRLNIQKKLGLSAHPIDLLLMFDGRKTQFITNNQVLYRECIINTFNAYAQENMEWFSMFKEWFTHKKNKHIYTHSLFNGVDLSEKPYLKFKIECLYVAEDCSDTIKDLSKEAENKAREIVGLPKIGEGWVSETALFRRLEDEFSNTKVIQHGRPTWLGRQHFDIWFPNWNIAVEYQGRQHFEPVEFFGGKETFHKTVELDKRKATLAEKHDVQLLIVAETDTHDNVVRDINSILKKRRILLP